MKLAILVLALAATVAVAFPQQQLLGRTPHGVRRTYPRDWNKLGRADPTAEVNFIVALRQRNLDTLDAMFATITDPTSPNYQQYMSREEILNVVAPAPAELAKVEEWLRSVGGVASLESLGDALEVRAEARVVESLFETEMHVFQHRASGRQVIKQFGVYSVPQRLDQYVHIVAGLSEFPVQRASVDKQTNSVVGVVPETLQEIYQIPYGTRASNASSQGVIEFEMQSYSPSQLATFAQDMAVKIAPLTSDHVIGDNQPGSPQVEATLDIQYIAAVGQGAVNWFWLEGDSVWLYGFAVHFFGTKDVPLVNSVSYGWNEADQCQDGIGGAECSQLGVNSQQYVARVNAEFQKIGLRGVSLIVAAGDSGVNGRTDEGCTQSHFNPDMPAGSAFVTTVGATELANPKTALAHPPPVCSGSQYVCASGGEEVMVSYNQAHFASGGGFAGLSATGAWQKTQVENYLKTNEELPPSSYYNASGRAYPDVSAIGSNVLINPGSIMPVGGTSASAPIFAGVIALLNDEVLKLTGKPLGFLNPFLYKMGEECADCYHDITVGDNKCTEAGCASTCKGFTAQKGWDAVSGWGSPNYANMLKYVQSKYA